MRIMLTVSYIICILTNFDNENYTDVNFEVYNQYVAQTTSFVIQCLREKQAYGHRSVRATLIMSYSVHLCCCSYVTDLS